MQSAGLGFLVQASGNLIDVHADLAQLPGRRIERLRFVFGELCFRRSCHSNETDHKLLATHALSGRNARESGVLAFFEQQLERVWLRQFLRVHRPKDRSRWGGNRQRLHDELPRKSRARLSHVLRTFGQFRQGSP